MKVFLKVIGCILLLIVVVAVGAGIFLTSGMKAAVAMSIQPVDVTKINDGVYTGSFGKGRWSNQVTVTVENHAITGIAVDKTVLFNLPQVEQAVIESVMQKQNTDIDIISGSTATSKSYLKSIENALSGKGE